MRPSRLLNIRDEVWALDFDLCAASRLTFFDLEKEKRQAEMLGMGQVNSMMGGAVVPKGFDTSKADRW